MSSYTPIPLNNANNRISLFNASKENVPLLGLDAPALNLMTDFTRTPAITVADSTKIDTALDQMIFSGVRLLFIVDADFTLLGLITSYDIQSEKPMLYLQSKDCKIGTCSRDDITVKDIMTPLTAWQILNYQDVMEVSLGNIVETFKSAGRRHLLVQDSSPDGKKLNVRGLFSVTAFERALGITIEIIGR